MFGGIIENQGTILEKKQAGKQIRFTIQFKKKERNVQIGESIAVNGVCLTVVKKTEKSFSVDVVKETLKATTLGLLEKGSTVNLERSLKFGDRLGGHFISGHVDGIGIIEKIEKEGKNQLWTVNANPAIVKFMALKGSAALDGISLTVQNVTKNSFKIAFIPHTLKVTTFGQKKKGDAINIEIDMLARYATAGKAGNSTAGSIQKQIKQLQLQGF